MSGRVASESPRASDIPRDEGRSTAEDVVLSEEDVDLASKRIVAPALAVGAPPAGRERIFRLLAALSERDCDPITACARILYLSIGMQDDADESLLDVMFTEAALEPYYTIVVLHTLALRGRIDALSLLYDHAHVAAQRFDLHCGDCNPDAAQRSLAHQLRKATIRAAELAHTAAARAYVEDLDRRLTFESAAEAERLRHETSLVLAAW